MTPRASRIDQRRAAGGGEVGLGLAVDDLEIDADLVADHLEEFRAIGGGAARLGRDQARAGDRPAVHLVAANAQRRHRAGNGGIRQPPRRGHALAEADDAGEGVDDAEAVPGGPRDQEPAVVGAEVEGGVGFAPALGRLGRPALAIIAAATPMRPAVGPRPIKPEVEVTGCPALVIHFVPFHRAEVSLQLHGKRHVATGYESVTVFNGAATRVSAGRGPDQAARTDQAMEPA